MVEKVLLIIVLLCVILSATGCQTVQGIGGDISWLAGARDEPSRSRYSYSSSGRNSYSDEDEEY
jgi:predicted small secreted protein